MKLVQYADGRLAIRLDNGDLLTVPQMHHLTPSPVRVEIFQAVLTRQFGMACEIADQARYDIEHDGARKLGIRLPVLTHNRSNQFNAAA